ncbi:MAG: hypothetical protein IPP34_06380 [Bacteroidetes bacterium]|nr:hypothetical protein [Bacteroidota bacterium]
MIRLNADGTIDSTFGDNGFATPEISTGDDFAYAAAEQPDHKIVLAGSALDATSITNPVWLVCSKMAPLILPLV